MCRGVTGRKEVHPVFVIAPMIKIPPPCAAWGYSQADVVEGLVAEGQALAGHS